jgi:hypothetical protein
MASTLYTSGTVVSSPWLNDVDTATYNRLTAVAGTNAITATGPLSLASISAGDRFYFVPAVTNTGAVTINISGLGVQPITKYGSTNLEAGDLVAGQMALIVYDGSLFQLLNPRKFDTTQTVPAANLTGTVAIANGGTAATTAAQALINLGATGRLIGTQVFTSTAVYTATSGTNSVVAELVGGGAGGGGCTVTAAGQLSLGGGGGGGGYVKSRITSGFSGQTVTVGAAGIGQAGLAGTAGTASTFLTLSAGGGAPGAAAAASTGSAVGGGAGGVATGGNLINIAGGLGATAFGVFATGIWLSGTGGASHYGAGATSVAASTTVGSGATGGAAPVGYGGGGGGAVSGPSTGTRPGGNGTPGIVIIYEYS